jgi:uncharacterized membrane-anchored protein
LSEIRSQDRIALVHKEIGADLQDCVRQIREVETLKQNSNVIPEVANSDDIKVQDLQQKQKEREEQAIQEARRAYFSTSIGIDAFLVMRRRI